MRDASGKLDNTCKSAREVFQEAAKEVLDGMRAQAPAPSPVRPEWCVLEDEDVSTSVYNVTFAAILAKTAEAAATPLRTLEGVARENIRNALLDAVVNPVQHGTGGRPHELAMAVKLIACEEMQGNSKHFHVPLKLSKDCSFFAHEASPAPAPWPRQPLAGPS